MAYLKRPQKGQKVLQSLFDSVNSIIDYLPTITVRGDNNSTYVEHTGAGTVVHAKQRVFPDQSGNGGDQYFAGSGLTLSGQLFNVAVDDDTIKIVNNKLSCTVEGGGGPSGPDHDTTYTGEYNVYSSGWISVDSSGSNPHLIYSNLRNIEQLYNYPLVANSNIVMPDSLTACNNTVDISQVGSVYSNHYIQTRDIFHDGAGTRINFSWMKNPFGDQSDEGTNGIIQGLQVDLTLSGGRFADVVLHKHVFGAYDPNTGTRYDPPDESRVDCLLTGTYDHPHTSGFIDIVPVQMEDGKTWGVISTNLHAGSGIAIDQYTGQISVTGAVTPSPGGGGCPWPNYDNLGEESNTLVYPLMRYSTSTGGWLRISCRSGTSRCVGVWVGDNYYGLGTGVMTWSLAIPPGNSFYVDVDWGLNNRVWFDGTVSPSTVTLQQYQYWFTPPEYIAQSIRNNISEVRNTLNNARYEQNQCYSYMTQAKSTLNSMINDWTVHEQYEPDEDYPDGKQPKDLGWYQDSLNYIRRKLSGNYEGDSECCEYHLDQASDYCTVGATLNASLPSACPMYTYQFSDVVTRSQQYYDDIEQYITSGQYYYNLAEQYWQSQE